jgi:hypothetical protein
VRADFQGGRIHPLLIRHGERIYRVARVNGSWEDREGRHKIYWFSVTTDSGDVFRVCLKSGEMIWWLDSIVLP